MSNTSSRSRPRWPWLAAGAVFALDQWTKARLVAALTPGQSLPVLPPLLHLTYVQNTGAAFGMLRGRQALFMVLSVAVIAWIAREMLLRRHRPTVLWGCALVLGGAAGNLVDRARLGYVIDFLQLPLWPVFNVADSAITIGVALLVLQTMFWDKAAS